ncbi:MAG: polysaccharide deacetylase family protein [Clostridia bacterium]|nr:polysaccharide deacetylase family protein [Clostridia bacterium]
MFDGKMKALTFSYDDGVTQDIRLVEIFNKYNLKCTFNLNSDRLGMEGRLERPEYNVNHTKVKPEDVCHIYSGHEVAVHTLTHPNLTVLSDDEVIRQVEEDRIKLSELCGYDVVGMAYPGGHFDDRVVDLIENHTGVKYSREVQRTKSFEPFTDLYRYKGTLYHHMDWNELFTMGEEFIKLKADTPKVFYIWGHAYEFDIHPERWEQFDEFCRMISGKNDIFYGTNKEILLAK